MMERSVNVYLRDCDVLLCDSEYMWDISQIVDDNERRKAGKLTEGKIPEPPHDLILCGQAEVTVDELEFYRHLLKKEIESKVEVQKELGKNIIELEAASLTTACDEDILEEAKRRGLL